jgi:DNA-binding transcriptional ArsR family regulator
MLLSYAWQNDFCFPGQVRNLGLHERNVRRHLKSLEANDLLAIQRRGQGKTKYLRIESQTAPHLISDVWRVALVRWFVLWLFADCFFRPDNLAETIIVIRLEAFLASRHSFVAGCQ